ncbi:MAG: hypothetical protein LBS16_00880 [Prevotellaceae bacterium]|jgi:hypothetical protein|nr:hypothetical protein [Prevotellaceae bacterium]
MMKKNVFLLIVTLLLTGCGDTDNKQNKSFAMSSLSSSTITAVIDSLTVKAPAADIELLKRGVNHCATFWTPTDGTDDEFTAFCMANFAATPEAKAQLFAKLQTNLEILYGNYNKINVDLKVPLHVTGSELTDIDMRFGALDPFAHFFDDMFASKIAFVTLLNFPFYTLEEKNTLGNSWTRAEWAYARLGDLYTARIPAHVSQALAQVSSEADNYISAYNIIMGNLRSEADEQLFADNMALISHWGLRDELKSNYSQGVKGHEKQRIIYEVIKHIVLQDIPQQVINDTTCLWKPISNKIYHGTEEIAAVPEPDTRYKMLYNIYRATIDVDAYSPIYSTYLQRAFDQQMEVSAEDIVKMFTDFITSGQVKQVAQLIETRLGRPLEPFDIWYDGFKSRSTLNEDDLSQLTRRRYPTVAGYEASLPSQLMQLGFSRQKAAEICAKVKVDPSRGAGHAWGALMKSDKARLRTRVAANGMDYKGYNIATHEFGHNVEQTISLNDVDNYVMNGVPSTAFTEALAFVFQKRDLSLLGYNAVSDEAVALQALDIFWGCYEIMGVALVDIRTWQWLYEHPNATVSELKATIIKNATDIWNIYYAPIFGEDNSPVLGIYSHMIDIPLYLPNYPYGHIVEFQLEQQIAGKNLGDEILRIYPVGRLTPNLWMQHAVGSDVSVTPLLNATQQAIDQFNSKH